MAKLVDVATRVMDLYFQDFPDRKAFFTLKDFLYHAAAKYSTILNAAFQAARKENKIETGFSNVEINAQWLITQLVEELEYDKLQQRFFVKTKQNIFSFDFDSWGNGLNGIRPYGNNTCNLKKISNQEIRFADINPTTPDIYYYLEGKNRIDFLKKPPLPLSLYYIPEVLGSDENCVLSDNAMSEVVTETLKTMLIAKQGIIIPEADDGNKNVVLPQQVNPALTKAQQ
jgi:hypothetical protein